jgi:hypothetical protein
MTRQDWHRTCIVVCRRQWRSQFNPRRPEADPCGGQDWMIEQRRSIFDSLLLQVVIPWLVSMNWLWALRMTRFWSREVTPAVSLAEATESVDVKRSV